MILALNFFSVEAETHPAPPNEIMSSQSTKCHAVTPISRVTAAKKPADSTDYYQSDFNPFHGD